MTLIEAIRPLKLRYAFVCQFLLVLMGSLFIAILSQFAIPIPFSPVPLTLQSFAVLLVGATLGGKKGALAIVAYLVEGAIGLPVFAGGSSGLTSLMGPTGGFLVGFVAAACVAGVLINQSKKNFSSVFFAFVIATSILLMIGSSWLSFFVGKESAFTMGVYPFLIGDLLKAVSATLIFLSGKRLAHFNLSR